MFFLDSRIPLPFKLICQAHPKHMLKMALNHKLPSPTRPTILLPTKVNKILLLLLLPLLLLIIIIFIIIISSSCCCRSCSIVMIIIIISSSSSIVLVVVIVVVVVVLHYLSVRVHTEKLFGLL